MSVLRRGEGRCVGRFPVLLVPWQFFRLADAVRCTGHRSALHRLLQRAALGFAARCVRHTSPHAIVMGALPMGNLPLSCILSIRSFSPFFPSLPFPHPLPASSSAAHPDTLGLPFLFPPTIPKSPALSCAHAAEEGWTRCVGAMCVTGRGDGRAVPPVFAPAPGLSRE